MIRACSSAPHFLICAIHAARSELKISPNNFEIRLLNFLQLPGASKVGHEAQVAMPLVLQQLLTLHHVALSFLRHPLHFPFRKARQPHSKVHNTLQAPDSRQQSFHLLQRQQKSPQPKLRALMHKTLSLTERQPSQSGGSEPTRLRCCQRLRDALCRS